MLLSRAFADFVGSDFDFERVGEYPVRGFNDLNRAVLRITAECGLSQGAAAAPIGAIHRHDRSGCSA